MIVLRNNTSIFNVFESGECKMFAHQANIEGVMGAGIAKEIASRYPESLRIFKNVSPFLGEVYFVNTNFGYIFHVLAQSLKGTGRKTNYEALYKGLEQSKKIIQKQLKYDKLAIPYGMGCGLGGGDWRVVSGILRAIFEDDEDFKLIVCKIS